MRSKLNWQNVWLGAFNAAFAILCYLAFTALLARCAPEQQIETPLPTPLYREASFTLWLPRVEKPPKKGIGLTYGNCADALAMGAVWFYTWGPQPSPCAGVESVPMIWGEENVCVAVSGTSDWLLGFNEPDRSNQADLTPCEAAELWGDVEQCYPDQLLASPAVSHTAVDWLQQFYDCYLHEFVRKPRLDALAVHCYANNAAECIATVEEVIGLADAWDVSGGVWVTEFAFWPTLEQTLEEALNEARTFIAWMDEEPRVARYAWFAARMRGDEWWMGPLTPLVEFDTGALTVYGMMYAEP